MSHTNKTNANKKYFLFGLEHILSPYYVWDDGVDMGGDKYYSLRHYLTYAKAKLFCNTYSNVIRNVNPYIVDGQLNMEQLKILLELDDVVSAEMTEDQKGAWEAMRRPFASEFYSELMCRTDFHEALYNTSGKILLFATGGVDPIWGFSSTFEDMDNKLSASEDDLNLSVEVGENKIAQVLQTTRQRLYKLNGMAMASIQPKE